MKKYMVLSGLLLMLMVGCKKGFLDEKPNKALLIPRTTGDFRALLDNLNVFNLTPALTSIADGDFYTDDAGWAAYLTNGERNSYTWSKDLFGTETCADWDVPYQQVFYSNVVLDGLRQLSPAADSVTAQEERAVKGTALFSRGVAFLALAQEFCADYLSGDPATLQGIPLRLSSDVTLKSRRAGLAETYRQITEDLLAARQLLPATTAYKSRPDQAAALGMLARVCLLTGDYRAAAAYADSCLLLHGALIDYNTLNASARRPFPRALPDGNPEVIWYAVALSYSFSQSAAATYVDTGLYRSYATDDLRRGIFFNPKGGAAYGFKGNYSGVLTLFSGLATDELYLLRAECRARLGDGAGAIADLNTLLGQRFVTGAFVPLSAGNADEALALVLRERRKELVGRGMRWADLRRLNGDERFRLTLERVLNGQAYTLAPESPRYVYPLPQDEIARSGLPQNVR